jgi:hypothetical protein
MLLNLGFVSTGPALCAQLLPGGPWQPLYNALVCGSDLPAGPARRLFLDTGLIHLMVVSGSHLVFLESLLGFLPGRMRLSALGGYCFLVGFQAPVMRALLRRLLHAPLTGRWGMSPLQVEAMTALLALALHPAWIGSRSFLMSWMCGLALSTPPLLPRRPHWDAAIKCYLFLLPFSAASPLTVGWNALLAPLVGGVLFPACLLALLIPPLQPLSDAMWDLLLRVLAWGPAAEPWYLLLPLGVLCGLTIFVHGGLLMGEVKWRRARAFLSW